jgi:hypothetical protein
LFISDAIPEGDVNRGENHNLSSFHVHFGKFENSIFRISEEKKKKSSKKRILEKKIEKKNFRKRNSKKRILEN